VENLTEKLHLSYPPSKRRAEKGKQLSTYYKDITLLNAKSIPSSAFNKGKRPHRNDLQFPNEYINLLN